VTLGDGPEAMERLAQAHRAGLTPAAFTLRERFLPDGSRPAGVAAAVSPAPPDARFSRVRVPDRLNSRG
jgi:hypothetical protein